MRIWPLVDETLINTFSLPNKYLLIHNLCFFSAFAHGTLFIFLKSLFYSLQNRPERSKRGIREEKKSKDVTPTKENEATVEDDIEEDEENNVVEEIEDDIEETAS